MAENPAAPPVRSRAFSTREDEPRFRHALWSAAFLPASVAGGAFLALLLLALWLFQGSASQDSTKRATADVGRVKELAVDMQTGLRAFQLTGQELFLDPWNAARAQIAPALAALETGVASDPAQLAAAREVRGAFERWLADAEEALALRRAGGDASALELNLQGKALFDEFRATVARMVATEEAYVAADAQERRRWRAAFLWVLGLGALAGGPALGWWLWRAFGEGTRAFREHATESERRAQTLHVTLRSIGDAVVTTDANGVVALLNPVAERLTGWSDAQAHGRPVEEVFAIFHEDTGERAESPVGRVLREKVVAGLANHTVLRARDGREIPIEDSAAPILDEAGEVLGVILVFHDVAEKRAQELALRAREERLRIATEAAQLGIFVWDVAKDIVQWENEQVYRQFGRTIEDGPITAADFAEKVVHPDERANFERTMAAALSGSTNFFYQGRFFRKDGVLCWIEFNGYLTRNTAGQPLLMLGTTADISERKGVEEALRASEARLSALVAQATAGISQADRDGRFIFVNDRFCALAGRSREELLTMRMQAISDPEIVPANVALYERLWREGAPFVIEKQYLRPDGSRVWVNNSVAPVFDPQGRVETVVCVSLDMTERRAVETALRVSEERFRELFDSIDEGFCVIKMEFGSAGKADDYRIMQANPAFEKHTGLVGAIGCSMRELAPGLEEYWFETYGRVARLRKPARFENHAEPMGRWFDVFAFPTGEAGSNQVGVLFTDITARKQAEAVLREAKARFRQLANTAPVVLWTTGPDGQCTFLSRGWYDFTGQRDGSGIGLAWLECVHPEDRGPAGEIFLSANARREPFSLDYRLRRADGE